MVVSTAADAGDPDARLDVQAGPREVTRPQEETLDGTLEGAP
jgi:hypothetical protein